MIIVQMDDLTILMDVETASSYSAMVSPWYRPRRQLTTDKFRCGVFSGCALQKDEFRSLIISVRYQGRIFQSNSSDFEWILHRLPCIVWWLSKQALLTACTILHVGYSCRFEATWEESDVEGPGECDRCVVLYLVWWLIITNYQKTLTHPPIYRIPQHLFSHIRNMARQHRWTLVPVPGCSMMVRTPSVDCFPLLQWAMPSHHRRWCCWVRTDRLRNIRL